MRQPEGTRSASLVHLDGQLVEELVQSHGSGGGDHARQGCGCAVRLREGRVRFEAGFARLGNAEVRASRGMGRIDAQFGMQFAMTARESRDRTDPMMDRLAAGHVDVTGCVQLQRRRAACGPGEIRFDTTDEAVPSRSAEGEVARAAGDGGGDHGAATVDGTHLHAGQLRVVLRAEPESPVQVLLLRRRLGVAAAAAGRRDDAGAGDEGEQERALGSSKCVHGDQNFVQQA